MVKGFREFIMKGNVIDLAVAFVIGAAFAALASTFVSKIITPILAALQGDQSIGLGFHLRPGNRHSGFKSSNKRQRISPIFHVLQNGGAVEFDL